MSKQFESKNNYDRLLKHLDEHSLAAQLVRAHANRDPTHPVDSIKAVLMERLEQVRRSIDNAKA